MPREEAREHYRRSATHPESGSGRDAGATQVRTDADEAVAQADERADLGDETVGAFPHAYVVEVVVTHGGACDPVLVVVQPGGEQLGQAVEVAAVDDVGTAADRHLLAQALSVVM